MTKRLSPQRSLATIALPLKFVYQTIWEAIQETVAIVDTTENEGVHETLRPMFGQVIPIFKEQLHDILFGILGKC